MIKLKDILNEASTSESYGQMVNLMKNGIPMMFPREEGELQRKYYDKVMNNGDVGVFLQAIQVGDPKAIKLWPKVEKVIKKNIADFYKEDIMIKKKLNIERNKMLMMMSKYGKKLSVNEGTLTERKFEMKGKYLYMPDGSMSSIPGDRDREDIVFSIGQKTFRLSSFGPGGKKMYIRGDYDKQFKNVNDLVKWLNKNKAKYIGLDN